MNIQSIDDELLDLVDINDLVIGNVLRSEVFDRQITNIRVVNLFLKNSLGQLWIPRRTAHKRLFPLCLDLSMGGYVASGETYAQALTREASEELNLDLNAIEFQLLGSLTPHADRVSSFMKVYEIQTDLEPEYNRDDFIEAMWMKPQELLDWIDRGEPVKSDLEKLVRRFYCR
jgi:8-oxo-dGTP pyrophosphatase MutT (NUDIX family)